MEAILNFSQPLDVQLLDRCVTQFYSNPAREVQEVLIQFQNHPDAWTKVDAILQNSSNDQSKMLALNILQNCVRYRWLTLSVDQRSSVKTFIVDMIIGACSSDQYKAKKMLINHLNRILVQVLRHEWPHNWPDFLPTITNSSKGNEVVCLNNMVILQLLSEEIFEADDMTKEKMLVMKNRLHQEFGQFFELCLHVLSESQNPDLLSQTLVTLQHFLLWIPIECVFDTPLVELLSVKFFSTTIFRNTVLECLADIASLDYKSHINREKYKGVTVSMFKAVSSSLMELMPPGPSIPNIYAEGDPKAQTLLRNLTNFISSVFSTHIRDLETADPASAQGVLGLHRILLSISLINDTVIFKICLDYWITLVNDMYKESISRPKTPLLMGRYNQENSRMGNYITILSDLRMVLVQKMPRPKEVLITKDEKGNIVRETIKDTDSIILYQSMQKCLKTLTLLDPNDSHMGMVKRLWSIKEATVMASNEIRVDWEPLNSLCWAIGSISGSMKEQREKQFLVQVIKDLLALCEAKKGKENKAVIASNIMYVVGQYPRFLKQHWKFLKTVVNKLFEFMHESFPGVQEMAVETFLTIAKACRQKFVSTQEGEDVPFIQRILIDLPMTVRDLSEPEAEVFYEAVGSMIRSESDVEKQRNLIGRLMESQNALWANKIISAQANMRVLWEDSQTIKDIITILRLNVRTAIGLGPAYVHQMSRIFVEMLHLYTGYSQYISEQVSTNGPDIIRHDHIRKMRTIKSEILLLIETFISNARNGDFSVIVQEFVPKLLDPILSDYAQNSEVAREANVLSLFAVIVDKLQDNVTELVPRILDSVFQCTLQMITADVLTYPDHRVKFFHLLRSITQRCFRALLMIDSAQFDVIINAIIWGIKHVEVATMNTALDILLKLLENMENSDTASSFYKMYLSSLIEHLFTVLTDTFHKSGFPLQTQILSRIFAVVERGDIMVPLWQGEVQQFANNQVFLRQHVANTLSTAFKENLTREEAEKFVSKLFLLCTKKEDFVIHVRDFLISLKEFKGEDNSALYPPNQSNDNIWQTADQKNVPGMVQQQS
eukprot:31501_1